MIHKATRWLAPVLAAGAVAAPAASATDLRSPDARDAAVSAQRSASPVDLRPPDARDAALAVERSRRAAAIERSVDLRSPDARDAVDPRQIVSSPPVEIVRSVEAGGFDWGDAAIGASVLLALMLMSGAGVLALRRGVATPKRPRASEASR